MDTSRTPGCMVYSCTLRSNDGYTWAEHMNTITRMQALRITTYGEPEVARWQEMPIPEPGPGEVLVRVAAAGINFMDVHTRQGKYHDSVTYPVRAPCTLGMEGAGVVEKVGPGSTDFAPGDRVAWCVSWGAFATYACVPSTRLVRVPEGLTLVDAAGVLFHGLTAHYLAYDVGQLQPGHTILVHAGGGNIANLLIQLAVARGVRVLSTASNEAKQARAREAGAEVMAYTDFDTRVRALTDGKGVDVCYDAIGKPTLRQSFAATRRKGLVVNYGSVGGPVKDLDPIELGEAGSLYLTRPRLADHIAEPETLRWRADEIFQHIIAGRLRPALRYENGWEHIVPAMEALESRTSLEKVVVRVSQDA